MQFLYMVIFPDPKTVESYAKGTLQCSSTATLLWVYAQLLLQIKATLEWIFFYMLNRCSGRRWVQHSIGQEALFETKQIYNGHKILIT